MQYSTVDLALPILAVFTVLLILSISVLVSVILHGRKIRKSEAKFRSLFNRVFDMLILIDKDGNITDVNGSAINRLELSREDFRERQITDFISEDRLTEFQKGFQNAYLGKSVYLGEFDLVGGNGSVLHAEVGCTGLEIQNSKFVLASLRDITGRKLAEKKLRDKNIALKAVLASLEEEKLKIKKQVSSNVEHVLLPALEKMKNQDGTVNMAYYKSLHQSLIDLATLSVEIGDELTKLSPRELEISKLTSNGLSAKEISKALNITVATVEKHRERIRKKLKISKTKTNLSTHLQKISRVANP